MNTLLLTSWIVCQSLDFGTTAVGLQRGFYEGNPALRGPQLYALKVSVNVGLFVWHQKDLRHRKGPVSALVPIAMATSGCAAGAINLHTLRSQR